MPFTYYADDDMVRNLAVNVQSKTPQAQLNTFKRMVDARLDSELGTVFENWKDLKATMDAPPEEIIVLASILTAARLEKIKFAVNEAGQAQPNPYAVDLENEGLQMLDSIKNGNTIVMGLTRFTPMGTSAAVGTFDPVGGLRTQGQGFNPFGSTN